ncbi:uncharacterized protein LOC131439159 [Malaya genurostris]|uniref:uncharacterized protein LOC131439159 n=1 Tax=Malaya genurostris TaxID=325434 RepID=UPI0026F402E0|nr:uncharacterized protein LOC131439159 [Malaya genurostris]
MTSTAKNSLPKNGNASLRKPCAPQGKSNIDNSSKGCRRTAYKTSSVLLSGALEFGLLDSKTRWMPMHRLGTLPSYLRSKRPVTTHDYSNSTINPKKRHNNISTETVEKLEKYTKSKIIPESAQLMNEEQSDTSSIDRWPKLKMASSCARKKHIWASGDTPYEGNNHTKLDQKIQRHDEKTCNKKQINRNRELQQVAKTAQLEACLKSQHSIATFRESLDPEVMQDQNETTNGSWAGPPQKYTKSTQSSDPVNLIDVSNASENENIFNSETSEKLATQGKLLQQIFISNAFVNNNSQTSHIESPEHPEATHARSMLELENLRKDYRILQQTKSLDDIMLQVRSNLLDCLESNKESFKARCEFLTKYEDVDESQVQEFDTLFNTVSDKQRECWEDEKTIAEIEHKIREFKTVRSKLLDILKHLKGDNRKMLGIIRSKASYNHDTSNTHHSQLPAQIFGQVQKWFPGLSRAKISMSKSSKFSTECRGNRKSTW